MEEFGAYLRQERELRAINLREVAQATKISLHALECLEAERFEDIGGEVFVRGFLRNYARYLGLDADDILLRYDEFRQAADDGDSANSYNTYKEFRPSRLENPDFAPRKGGLVLGAAGAAVLVAMAVFIFWIAGGKQVEPVRVAAYPSEVPAPMTEATTLTAVTAPTDATTAVESTRADEIGVTTQEDPDLKPVSLEILATQRSYLRIWIDGEEELERELPPGAEMRFEGRENIELLAGNAGGLSLTVNGKPLGVIGPEGKVRRRVVTIDGISPP